MQYVYTFCFVRYSKSIVNILISFTIYTVNIFDCFNFIMLSRMKIVSCVWSILEFY